MAMNGDSLVEAKDASPKENEFNILRELNAKLIDELALLRKQQDANAASLNMQEAFKANGNGAAPSVTAASMPGVAAGLLPIPVTNSNTQKQGSKDITALDPESSLLNGHPFRWRSAECFAHRQDGLPLLPNGNDADCPTCELNVQLDDFRKQLGDITGRLEDWGQNGNDAWERILALEGKVKEIIPVNSKTLGRKELRHLKGAKVQELAGVLRDLSTKIHTCQHSLMEDGKAVVESVRSDLVEVLLGIDTLMAHRRQEVQILNESGQRIQDLEASLERVEQEKRDAIVERDELHNQLKRHAFEFKEEHVSMESGLCGSATDKLDIHFMMSQVQDELGKTKNENDDLKVQISELQEQNRTVLCKVKDLDSENRLLKVQISNFEQRQSMLSNQELKQHDEVDVVKTNIDGANCAKEMSIAIVEEDSDNEYLRVNAELSELRKKALADKLKFDKVNAAKNKLATELFDLNEQLSQYKAQTTDLHDELCKTENKCEDLLIEKNNMKSELVIMQTNLKGAQQSLNGLEQDVQNLLGARNELQHLVEVLRSELESVSDLTDHQQYHSKVRELGSELLPSMQSSVGKGQEKKTYVCDSDWHFWASIGFGGGLLLASCVARLLQK